MHLLFDLDGTLGDTLPLCIAAFREAIEPLAGRKLSDKDIIDQFGPSEEGTIMALIPQHYDEGMARYIEAYTRLHPMCPEPFPGIVELLQELKERGHYVGMVTGKGPISTRITLQAYGLENAFATVRTGSPKGPVKDKHFRDIIAESGLPAEAFLYVGDTPSDIEAAHSCGMPIASAAWAGTADIPALQALHPEHLFTSIEDFRAYLWSL